MLKLTLKLAFVLVVMLLLAGQASASNVVVTFDPDPPQPPGGGTNLYYLTQNGLFSVSWQTCAVEPTGVLPSGSTLLGDTACLGFANDTGAAIPDVQFTFTVTSGMNGATLSCSNDDPYLSINNCASYGTLTSGETVTLDFLATSASNDVPIDYDFYLGLGGSAVSANDLPQVEVQVPTYDPSTLILLLAGMSALAVAGIRRTA